METLAPNLNFCGVLSESKRIIKAHSRHFLALSVLFLLPLSFSLMIYPILQTTLSESAAKHTTQTLLRLTTSISDYSLKTLALPLIFFVFIYLLSLCAVATITCSTYHGFYGRPVKLAVAFKSLARSFVPLLVTDIASHLVLALVCSAFALLLLLATKGVEILGFAIDYDSTYFIGLCNFLLVILVLVIVHLRVNWALASAIVVVESKWGFAPLGRSTHLVKGMRAVSLSVMLFYGIMIAFPVWTWSGTSSDSFSDGWKCGTSIFRIVVGSSFMTIFILQSVVSHTALYMLCNAFHGQLAWETSEEFYHEYVSLSVDDAKVPQVVFDAQA